MAAVEAANPKAAKPPIDRGPGLAAVRAIDPRLLYPLRDFRRLAGLGDFSMRKLRRQGLRILEADRKQYVLGQDFLDFLLRQGGRNDTRPDEAHREICCAP